jgi:predicted ester cyclase
VNEQDEREGNIAVVRAFFEALNHQDVDAAIALCAEDFSNHGRTVWPRGLGMVLGDLLTMFPDRQMEIVDVLASGDAVVVRGTSSGTHLGVSKLPVEGGLLMGVEPTGKYHSVQHIHWFTVRGGQLTSHYANRDDVSMMVQLGLLPAPPPFPGMPPRS